MTIHQTEFEQGSLVKHRLFVAIRPSPGVIPAIAAQRRRAVSGSPVRDDRLHMTLFIIDDLEGDPSGIARIMADALDTIRAEAFPVALERFGHRGDSLQPVRAPKLRRFQREIADALGRDGVRARSDWAFNPHVTLGYGGTASLAGTAIAPISWVATEFVLIHSLLRLTIHRTLGTWPLIEQPRLL